MLCTVCVLCVMCFVCVVCVCCGEWCVCCMCVVCCVLCVCVMCRCCGVYVVCCTRCGLYDVYVKCVLIVCDVLYVGDAGCVCRGRDVVVLWLSCVLNMAVV